MPASAQRARRPKRIFLGLIKCAHGAAGWRRSAATTRAFACSARQPILRRSRSALAGLRHHMAHPEIIAHFVTVYNAERKRLRREAGNERARLERRLGEIGREVTRLVDSVAKAACRHHCAQDTRP